jgi:hypothetical protein
MQTEFFRNLFSHGLFSNRNFNFVCILKGRLRVVLFAHHFHAFLRAMGLVLRNCRAMPFHMSAEP